MKPQCPPPSLHSVEPLDLDSLASSLDLSVETRTSVASLIESWDELALSAGPRRSPRASYSPPARPRPKDAPAPMLWGSLVKLWEGFSAAEAGLPDDVRRAQQRGEDVSKRARDMVKQMQQDNVFRDCKDELEQVAKVDVDDGLLWDVDMEIGDDDVSFDRELDDVRRLMSGRKRGRDDEECGTGAFAGRERRWGQCGECGQARDRSEWAAVELGAFSTPRPAGDAVRRMNTAPSPSPFVRGPRFPSRKAAPNLRLDLSAATSFAERRRRLGPVARRLELPHTPRTPRSPPAPAQRRCITRDPAVDRQLAYKNAVTTSPVTPVITVDSPLGVGAAPRKVETMEGIRRSVARRLSYQEVREARRRRLVEEQRRVNSKLRSMNMGPVPKNTRLPGAGKKETDRSGGTISPTDVKARWI